MIIKLKRCLFLDVAEDFDSVVIEVRDFDLKLSLAIGTFQAGFLVQVFPKYFARSYCFKQLV